MILVDSLKSALSTQAETVLSEAASCCYIILNWSCDLDVLARPSKCYDSPVVM